MIVGDPETLFTENQIHKKIIIFPWPQTCWVSKGVTSQFRPHFWRLRYRLWPPLSRSDITYLLTRADSLPGPRLLELRGKLWRGRDWGAPRTESSLPWWAAWGVLGVTQSQSENWQHLLISCAYLDYLKINERFKIWLIVLWFMSRRRR